MKKFLVFSFAFIFAITPLFAVNFAFAAGPDYASSVADFSQGNKKDASPVDVGRSDPNEALGVEDGLFVSLGYGGTIDLEFPLYMGGGALSITSHEVTNGDYPLEVADVYVSNDGVSYSFVGTVDNSSDDEANLIEFREACFKFVRLVDVTDGDLHNDSSDGYDLDAVSVIYDSECQPEDPCDPVFGNDYVFNHNSAFVANRVSANSNTGGNVAEGSYGGDGGDGGAIRSGEVDDSSTGNGGRGGDAGVGGTVLTGNANSNVDVTNEVNNSRTNVDRCACETDNCCGDGGDVMVFNRNRAIVLNDVEANSNTGENMADGSYGGEGGDGGTIGGHEGDSEVDDSSTGNGGTGGSGAEGGYIESGNSRSVVGVVNVINRTITRIFR